MAAGSFSAGLSGLSASQTALSVIGNNLANLNTVAYKDSTVTFADLVSQNVSGTSENPMQVGLGVSTSSISPVFSQGSISSTSSTTDVAIQGNGFFVVQNTDGTTAYTRDGEFSLDSDGYLVSSDGYRVQGYMTKDASGSIVTTGPTSDIIVSKGTLLAPTATTTFQALTNLNAAASVGDTFTTSVEMYDSQGTSHTMTITYTNTGSGTWGYKVTAPGAEVTGGTKGTDYSLATGTIGFDSTGKLSTVNGAAAADVTITTPTWTDGASANTLTWDLVDSSGTGTLTGYSATSSTSSITQDGTAAGEISDVKISTDGTITGTLASGSTVALGKLALATFNNPNGLSKLGANKYTSTEASGLASVGQAGAGGRGTLVGSALEQSNVDMASEFTSMILAQRCYQANAKTITVADELLQSTLNLKQ